MTRERMVISIRALSGEAQKDNKLQVWAILEILAKAVEVGMENALVEVLIKGMAERIIQKFGNMVEHKKEMEDLLGQLTRSKLN